ncbi:MAG: benzoate/H(+) symporter BenE family transporter [Nitratireductor sp.]|nr:benzoate/H(+) symporter BenE family transporter [Nitratireductor sp.]
MRFSIFSSAIVAAVVGFGSTLALIIAAAIALDATPEQTGSWVTAICIAKVFETLILSWRHRIPIITAWSTAGLALIGASSGITMGEAVGSFLLAALLLVATGLFRPLTTLVARIPPSVSAGMLAGILLPFAMAAAKAAQFEPHFVLPLAALFFLVRLFSAPFAVIAVLGIGVVWALLAGSTLPPPEASTLTWVKPEFSIAALIGLGVPIYLVTMASQNLPGMAVLKADGYDPPAGPIVAVTGFFSFLSAFFGASTTNLAAITAAICTGEDTHPDKTKRWLVAFPYAACYALFAFFGASLAAIFASLPPTLIALIAGLALLAPLANAAAIALAEPAGRLPATATFAITASGVAFFGVGAAFWGLAAGLTLLFLPNLIGRGRSSAGA